MAGASLTVNLARMMIETVYEAYRAKKPCLERLMYVAMVNYVDLDHFNSLVELIVKSGCVKRDGNHYLVPDNKNPRPPNIMAD